MGEDDGDAHTLGLLVDMRDLCTKIAEEHHHYAAQLHELLRQVKNPNVHGLDKELTFRVEQLQLGEPDQYAETLRAMSLNSNMALARAAFGAAVKHYPNQRWILKWAAQIVERYDPPAMKKTRDE
jgi:hypothetical protein